MNKKRTIIILTELAIIIFAVILVNTVNITQYTIGCWFYQATGLQCPSCGGTRCIINIFQGNFKEAFFLHPIYFITVVYLLIVNIIYIINIYRKEKKAKWIYHKPWYAIVLAIILVVYGFLRNII